MKALNSVLAMAILTLITGACNCCKEYTEPHIFELQNSYYDAEVLKKICPDSKCDSIRFYTAKYSILSTETLMAVGVHEGADIFTDNYYFFKSVSDDTPKYNAINRNRAKRRSLKPQDDNRFAVTFSKEELLALIPDDEPWVLAISPALTSDGKLNTLLVRPVLLKDDLVEFQGTRNIKSELPCPTYCGSKPKEDYVWGDKIAPASEDDREDPRDKDD